MPICQGDNKKERVERSIRHNALSYAAGYDRGVDVIKIILSCISSEKKADFILDCYEKKDGTGKKVRKLGHSALLYCEINDYEIFKYILGSLANDEERKYVLNELSSCIWSYYPKWIICNQDNFNANRDRYLKEKALTMPNNTTKYKIAAVPLAIAGLGLLAAGIVLHFKVNNSKASFSCIGVGTALIVGALGVAIYSYFCGSKTSTVLNGAKSENVEQGDLQQL